MNYQIGDLVTTKKKHVCGGDVWEVVRIGAEIRIQCAKCGREIMMMKSELDKKIKSNSK